MHHGQRTALLALAASVSLLAAAPTAATTAPLPTAPERLHALFEDEHERDLRESPTFASYLGDLRYNHLWPDESMAAIERSQAGDRAALERLHTIPRAELAEADQVNYDLFERDLEESIAGQRFPTYRIPIGQMGGIQTLDEITENLSFTKVKDYEDWIARMRALGVYMDQTLELMRAGVASGWVPPRVTMERVPNQIAAQLVEKPEESPFYDPFEEFPASVPAAEQERLRTSAAAAIREVVIPAYRRLDDYFTKTYLPATRQSVAVRDLPDGEALYAYLVRSYTTTARSPQEIHDLGLSEVARIRAEMDKVIAQVGFKGSFAEFLQYLRTDPKFYYQDPQELLAAYREIAKRIDPELTKLFGKLPRTPYGVRPIPDTIAPDTTTAYYNAPAGDGSRPGWYYVNLYKPETRPKYEMEALSAHEAVPGHHLQLALQQELGDLPAFRRFGGYTAFVEGWGLYSESLGGELGLYQDPYSKFGQLTYEMWRAVRLVVDTGMHNLGWSRERAIEYFRANAAKTEQDIVNEIDRYITTPGQALAYKIGELKIKELRHRAEERLGPKFDIRAFHDKLLGSGALPLDVLEHHMDEWIAAQAKAN